MHISEIDFIQLCRENDLILSLTNSLRGECDEFALELCTDDVQAILDMYEEQEECDLYILFTKEIYLILYSENIFSYTVIEEQDAISLLEQTSVIY